MWKLFEPFCKSVRYKYDTNMARKSTEISNKSFNYIRAKVADFGLAKSLSAEQVIFVSV